MTELERFQQLLFRMQENNTIIFAGSMLQRAALFWPKRLALLFQDQHISFKELFAQAAAITELLRAKGVTPEDTVALLWQNTPEFYIMYFGIWQTGAVVVPLNTFLTAQEIQHILKDSNAKYTLVSTHFKELVQESCDRCIFEEELMVTPLADEQLAQFTIPKKNSNDLALLLYTSGTTGVPKGVMMSSHAIVTNAVQGISKLTIYQTDKVFACLPLFHSFSQNACIWAPVLIGCTIVLVPKITRAALIEGLRHKPTFVIGVPALYMLFCSLKYLSFSHVRYFLCGADVLTDKLRSFFAHIYRRKICNGYGLTEAGPFVSGYLDEQVLPASTVGKPLPKISVSVRDKNDVEVPHGTVATIWVHGDSLMMGYYNAPEATAAMLSNNALDTGDLGYIDSAGRLVLAGREKELIVRKGVKIYPQEIESVLLRHPSVMQAAVIGKEIDGEEVPVAFVGVLNYHVTAEELLALCKENLAAYKVPNSIEVRKNLPSVGTGKVDKKKLKAEL